MRKYVAGFVVAASLSVTALSAHADKLDDIIDFGKLRCAITLDFPPMELAMPTTSR